MTFEEYQKQWAQRDFERALRVIRGWRSNAPTYKVMTLEELYEDCCLYAGFSVFIPFDMFKDVMETV